MAGRREFLHEIASHTSKLRNIRGNLSEINSKVWNLESNMIFLLMNPQLVMYRNQASQNTQSSYDPFSEEEQPMVMTVQQTDFGQEQYIVDPSELHGLLDGTLGSRHELMVAQAETLHIISDLEKKSSNDPSSYNNDHSDADF